MTHPSPPPHHGRRAALVAAGAALIGGLGCATVSTLSRGDKVIRKAGPVVLQDTLLAIARPDAKLAAQLSNPDALAFVGKQHTYLLTTGGQRLLALAKQLDPTRLQLAPDQDSLYLRDGVVWGHVALSYTPAEPDREAAQLATLNFERPAQASGAWQLRHPVQGKALPPVPPAGLTNTQTFQRERALTFHAPPTEERTPDLGKYALLPLSVAVDVITAPLQLLGVAILALVVASN